MISIARKLGERLQAWAGILPPEKRLGKDAVISLWIHSSFQFGNSMAGIFLNLYLWRLTGSLWINGMYNIINYSVTALGFVLGGWIAKRRDRLVSYRFGITLFALFYLMVIAAGEQVARYYVLFALFGGIAGAFYWIGYLVLMYDVSDDRNRIHYMAMNMIFFTAAGLVGPPLAGRIISANDGLHGYMIVFSLAFVMFLMAAVGSFFIKRHPLRHKTYYLKFALSVMRRKTIWLKALIAFFVLGLFQGIMLFLPNIMLYQVFKREDWVGYLGMLFAALTILTGMLMSKYAKEEHARLYVAVSAVGMALGSCFLLANFNTAAVLAFLIAYALFSPLQGNTLSAYYYRMIGVLPLKQQFRVETVVMREMFINLGRIVSIFCLIAFAEGVGGGVLAWILFVAATLQLLLVPLVRGKVE